MDRNYFTKYSYIFVLKQAITCKLKVSVTKLFKKFFFLEVQHNDLMFVYIVKWLNKSSSYLSQYIF